MRYKVIIKKCTDPDRATKISEAIAQWSGSTVDVVRNVIVQKPVCIRKEAEQDEALKLKSQFEATGAEVELVPLGEAMAAPVAASPSAAVARASVDSDDDEEDFAPGRKLSDAEYADILKKRPDIFKIETESRLRNIEIVMVIVGMAFGFWLTTMKIIPVTTDFIEKLPAERSAKFVDGKVLDAQLEKKKEEKKDEEIKTDKVKIKPSKSKGAGGTTGGGGDPRARVTRQGVLGIISGQIKGKSVASADIFGKGGFAQNIDAVLSGVGGLKAGGGGGAGRRGAAGIGYGAGYGSGFGGGATGVDDLISGLMGGDGSSGLDLGLKKRGSLAISAPTFTKGGALTGGRSRESIMRVVMQNLAALRYAYNKRLREKPGLKGKVTAKFAIDEFGKVIFCNVIESTIEDPTLEEEISAKIKRWVFEKIDKPGDVTEVVYPFVFSQ